MFKVPFISDIPSTVKTRPGFHDPNDTNRATPSFTRSVSRENLVYSSSIVRSFGERDEFCDVSNMNANTNNAVAVRNFELNEDPSFWKDHNVQVIIRLRPLNSSEISLQGHSKCVRQESCQTITWTGHPESRFTFDVVADETVTQEKLFKVAGVPMVENCVGGYNNCMFAYGQTGSGKTHTMLGDIEGGTRRHSVNCGMTPRVFEYLFSRLQKEKEARRDEKFRFICKCSFLEIYNEQILDLLNPSSVNLQIREDLKKGVYVENLTEIEVSSAREVMQQLLEGAANRKVAATNMNHASSRSHSVFTCVIESTWESQGVTHHRFARLNLVDLAGSERQKSSGAEGERLKEATNINKSLSTLGLVIMNLVSISNGKSLHVPYRDSKLTFLLQDSLGGNSKTIIIANISPSNCCSLETLSTLKFAQRAKFIKNNAIVNEDASGDVLAMRMQIQQLKKEVSHLHGLLNGGGAANRDTDHLSSGFPTSPGPLKWEGLNGTFSPLTSDKKMSQKEYEVALVGAFRREKDKDTALQALTAENQTAMQLAKQRQDEIQGLKMRLRFREAGIKRLEAVASGKISAETHLLEEKEEHLKEIEVLHAQVDRNQEVTRFAMENLRLKEEIRRLKSLYEEGEVERMNEQISTLQNKLLEALDWKLMNETGPSNKQRSPDLLDDSGGELDQLNSDKKSVSPWETSIKEENEFLRLQAIQNQAEIDSLRKKLNSCMEEKTTLERHTKDLETELEATKTFKEAIPALQMNLPSEAVNEIGKISLEDQMELKAMVDAIATASQREAEAHEIAITLTKEHDELHAKIKVLIEDNNKLIELYERAVADTNYEAVNSDAQLGNKVVHDALITAASDEKSPDKKKLEELEQQLAELHEENEKLMNLYENAMQERDDFKKKLSSALHNRSAVRGKLECPEKLVEVDGDGYSQQCGLLEDSSTGMDIDGPTLSDELETLQENSFSQCAPAPFSVTETAVQIDKESDGSKNLAETDLTVDCWVAIQYPDERRVSEISPWYSPRVEEKNYVEFDVGLDEQMNSAEVNATIDPCETAMQHLGEGQLMKISPRCSPRTATKANYSVKFDVELDEGKNLAEANSSADCFSETAIQNLDENPRTVVEETNSVEQYSIDAGAYSKTVIEEKIVLVKKQLDKARERLSSSSETVSEFGVVENAVLDVEKLSKEIEATKNVMQLNQHQIGSVKLDSSEVRERGSLILNKLSALTVSLSSITSSIAYFEQREARARARVEASLLYLEQNAVIFTCLQAHGHETKAKKREIQEAETEARKKHSLLKSKLEEENQRLESERVLFEIDNVEKKENIPSHDSWKLGSKATDLLKSEEMKIKLQNEIKQSREMLGALKKEIEELSTACQKVHIKIRAASLEIEKTSKICKETELGLQNVIHEKEALLETKESGETDINNLISEYYKSIFEESMREELLKILEEDMRTMSTKFDELQAERAAAASRATKFLNGDGCKTGLPSEKMREELRDVWASILEAESLLVTF